MQANAQSTSIVDLLREKDQSVEYPSDWDKVRANKNFYLLAIEEKARYEHVAVSKCLGPCFNNLKTSVVNTEESNCMTNCFAKSLETRALFDYLHAKDTYKKQWDEIDSNLLI